MQNETLLNHSFYLNIVKRILRASYVGWVTEKDKKYLRVVVKGTEHQLPIEEEIRHETYAKLIKELTTDEQL